MSSFLRFDPNHFKADPGPYPAFHFNADPNPDPDHWSADPPWAILSLHCERP
jgi:hypothetical protein